MSRKNPEPKTPNPPEPKKRLTKPATDFRSALRKARREQEQTAVYMLGVMEHLAKFGELLEDLERLVPSDTSKTTTSKTTTSENTP